MFTLLKLDELAKEAVGGLIQLNSEVLRALGKRLALVQKGGFDRLLSLTEADREAEALYLAILKELDRTSLAAAEVYRQAARLAYEDMSRYYAAKGLSQVPIEQQRGIVNFVEAVARNTQESFSNLSGTRAIGYRVLDKDGVATFAGFRAHYHNLVDQAIADVAIGQESYGSALRKALRQTADSGIRVLDYGSGASRRLDSAMRQNVLDGVKDIAHEVARETGKEFGADGVEVDAHDCCSPDHLPYQGRQYSLAEWEKVQGSLKRGIGMWNCRHTVYPILLGVSVPAYTEEELAKMEASSTAVIEFESRRLTRYEATQLQRRIETEIRASKDRAVMAKAVGDEATRRAEQLRINQLRDKYVDLSRGFVIPEARDRMRVSGFKGVGVPKASQPLLPIEPIDLFSGDNYSLGLSKDLTPYYSVNEDVRPYLQRLETHISPFAKKHIREDHPERITWISNHPKEIAITIQQPDLVESKPWKRNNGHWTQTFIREFPDEAGFVVVAVSLANLPGESECEYHQVTTIYFSIKRRDFYDKDNKLKPRWLLVK